MRLDTTREKFAERGRRFATPHAVDEALRIYGPGTTLLLHGEAAAVARVKIDAVLLRAGLWCAALTRPWRAPARCAISPRPCFATWPAATTT